MKIPFGKHNGRALVEVMAEDPQYVDWMMQQAWFAEKFKPLYELAKAGLGSGADNTPAHNAMQVKFLDVAYCTAVAAAAWHLRHGYAGPSFSVRHTDIESDTDVVLIGSWEGSGESRSPARFNIELKPSLGDDYPAVIRQVRAQRTRANERLWRQRLHTRGQVPSENISGDWIVLAGQFSAQGATLEQARAMLSHAGMMLLLAAEVDGMAQGEGA